MKMKILSWIIAVGPVLITRALRRRRGNQKRKPEDESRRTVPNIAGLKGGGRVPRAMESVRPLQAGKDQEMDPPLQKGAQCGRHPDWAH